MQYQNSGNPIIKNLISAFGFIALAVLLFTATTVLLQLVGIVALLGLGAWSVYKLLSFIKSKISHISILRKKREEKLVVEIVEDIEIKSSFTHKDIVDVEYEEF